jgi:hypothetical protein
MGLDLDVNVEDVIPILQAAAGSPVYRDKVVMVNTEKMETTLNPSITFFPDVGIIEEPRNTRNYFSYNTCSCS